MKSLNSKRRVTHLVWVSASLLLSLARVSAVEDPPGCSLNSGGAGNTSQGGINFSLAQAHIGDTVEVFPSLGMSQNACRAINATGIVYVATGPLTNFLVNVTLDPGPLVSCPANVICQPGPYNVLITSALVGASVNTPVGGVSGVAKTVRVAETAVGTVLAGEFNEQLTDFHSASIQIVTPCIRVFKTCDLPPQQSCFPAEALVRFHGYVTNCGDITLTNVTVVDNRAGQMQLFNPANGLALTNNVILSPGAYAVFSNSFLPSLPETCARRATNVITATARDTTAIGGPNASVSDAYTDVCEICPFVPALVVTRTCPPGLVLPGGVLAFTGTVTNTGNISLTNVTIVSSRLLTNGSPVVANFPTLAQGEFKTFSGSYLVPTNVCSVTDTLTALASDVCGSAVTAYVTNTCAVADIQNPVITCPSHLVLTADAGQCSRSNVAFTVTATDNCSLSNLVSSLPSGSTFPYGVTTVTNIATDASGNTSRCTFTVTVTNTTRIAVTKRCPAIPVAPGELATVSGVVSNAGTMTLLNVVVVDNVPVENTVLLGPITLLAGQAANFTGSYLLPLNCCSYFDTVTATGTGACSGSNVVASATALCPTATDARLAITRSCPDSPVSLGQPLVFSGVVSNAGNITLTNVTVVNNQPSNNTPVLGPITLGPGETADFTGAYLVPMDVCTTSFLDTVTARGASICGGTSVSASQSAPCPIQPTPLLVVTKNCPASPVPQGGLLEFSGTVSNAGNITLTNVMVVNDHPTNGTPVLGPLTLAPNQATNFSGSYRVCLDCCPPYVDTVSVSGAQICDGSNITAAATAYCPGLTQPQVQLTVDCPLVPVLQGQLVFYSGSVSNSGDVTMGDVLLADNQAGFVTQFSSLAPTETADFFGVYQATCGPGALLVVTATAFDVCAGGSVSNQASASCPIICLPNPAPVLVNRMVSDGQFKFSITTEPGRAYSVQYTDALIPGDWQPLTNFIGDGNPVTITEPMTQQQRFYRVLPE